MDIANQINTILASAQLKSLQPEEGEAFALYFQLLEEWNRRVSLTAMRDADQILRRHFVECIFAARNLPQNIPNLLDFGSGAGFPGLPIAICRKDIEVTLAESQGKKAAFLNEVVRQLGLKAHVHSSRAENLHQRFSAVTLRAVDKMENAVSAARNLLIDNGWLILLTSQEAGWQERADIAQWEQAKPLPSLEKGILLTGRVPRGTIS